MTLLTQRQATTKQNGHASTGQSDGTSANDKAKTATANSNKKMILSFLAGFACCWALGGGAGNGSGGWSQNPTQQQQQVSRSSSSISIPKDEEEAVETTTKTAEVLEVEEVSPAESSTDAPKPTNEKEDANKNKSWMNQWSWYKGDVNQYYNELEKDIKRNPKDLNNYAVHRWMGTDRSTKHHYQNIYNAIATHTGLARGGGSSSAAGGIHNLKILDAGCGLGAAMMWFEKQQPTWKITGRTLSEEQSKFIEEKLPNHNFAVELRSYDDLDEGVTYDVIYSIEAMIHSPDIHKSMSAWAKHLDPNHGSLIIIDDFLMRPDDRTNDEAEMMEMFQKGWMANSFYTVPELNAIGRKYGIELVESRDLLAEYRIVELNYQNKVPNLSPDGKKTHQGWIGSKVRHKLTVEGKIGYNMIVFQKMGAIKPSINTLFTTTTTTTPRDTTRTLQSATTTTPPATAINSNGTTTNFLRSSSSSASASSSSVVGSSVLSDSDDCQPVPTMLAGGGQDENTAATFSSNIVPKDECISSWYCCDQAEAYLDNLDNHRTHSHGFLKMDRELFGNYMNAFAKHLNQFYETIPSDYTSGRFLDIGATGSTSSGMQQVTTKFSHFSGPLQYWMLDSDKGAKTLNQTIYCDVCDCPQAESCGYDVTFSHTVLEHAARPEKAFDTIARLTKPGGLTMHLVPWSYQYHATPDDYYRFSHSALRVLMEDRGFEPLEIGYDLCSKPEKVMKEKRVDEHYDFIWLTYVIARKKTEGSASESSVVAQPVST